MVQFDLRSAARPPSDAPMVDIAEYVVDHRIESEEAFSTAHYMLLDSLACAALAMDHGDCVRHLGPLVPEGGMPGGARVPFTAFELDPVQAAYNIGVQIRWLDFNDTWLAAEWGHPSDNLGAILAVADYLGWKAEREGRQSMAMRDVLTYAIKAHEIQGCYALRNAFNRVGLDHVILVRLASTAVATRMLGGGREEVINAVSHSWLDNGALRAYRHAPNTGPRKSWAAGDAGRRAVIHALNAVGNIEVAALPARYPAGSEKQLIVNITGREVPAGAMPASVGVLVHNVGTAYAIHQAIRFGRPLVSRIVTVAGDAVMQPRNVEVPIGTLVTDLLQSCGVRETPARLLMGGPMMGMALPHADVPIIKGTSGVLALASREVATKKSSPCVRCGRCVNACPVGLVPLEMAQRARHDDMQGAAAWGVMECIACGQSQSRPFQQLGGKFLCLHFQLSEGHDLVH